MKRLFIMLLALTMLLLCACEDSQKVGTVSGGDGPSDAETEEEPIVRMSADELLAYAEENLVEHIPALSTEEFISTPYGEIEHISYKSSTLDRERWANVLLPPNYDETKKYPVLYALHGYWGDEYSLLDQGDASIKIRVILGNAIKDGDASEMIVVFPDIFCHATKEDCDGMNDENNKAYDNFINELINDLMPYIESHYSVATGRDNTAITGFSMGGRESLYIGFSHPELFGYIGAVCPAPGVTTDCIKPEEMVFEEGEEPYLVFLSAGSNDTVVYTTPQGYHDQMTTNGVPHVWHYVNSGEHGGSTIRPHFWHFLRFIFK